MARRLGSTGGEAARPRRRADDRAKDPAAWEDAQGVQEPAADERADDPDHNISEQTEAVTLHNYAGEPARNRAGQQPDEYCLERLVFSREPAPTRAGVHPRPPPQNPQARPWFRAGCSPRTRSQFEGIRSQPNCTPGRGGRVDALGSLSAPISQPRSNKPAQKKQLFAREESPLFEAIHQTYG